MKLPPTHKPIDSPQELVLPKRFGERLMHTMGWEKGQGLGKEGTGIKTAIRAKKKDGLEGVGSKANAWDWSDDWWAKSFNQAAGTLQEIRAQGSPDSSASADTAQLDTSAAAAVAALTAAEPAEQRPSAASTGLDRWGGFRSRAGKMARIMRQEALVGPEPVSVSAAAEPAEAGPQRKKRKQGKADSQQEAQPSKPEQRKAPRVIEVVTEGPEPEPFELPPRPSNWWGASRFVSTGCMGSMREQEVKEKQGFTEDDQANLHERLNALNSRGKSGLGTGQAARLGTDTMKVKAAERWAGNKVSFDEDAEADPAQDAAGAAPASAAEPAVKWRKLCFTILQQQDGQKLKLRKLEKLFLSRLSTLHGPDVAKHWQDKGLLQSKMMDSKKFRLEGKSVSLVQ